MKKDITVGEIVANDYRAAFVFKEAGIDFFCGGKKSIDQTCSEKGIDRNEFITSDYKVPADGCNTYNVTFKLLREFEDDLHTHVHLESNILFPKALRSAN